MCPDGDLLSAYLDGELDPRWRREIEDHVAGCAACSESLARLREVRSRLESQDEPDMVDAMVRVRNALVGRIEERARWRPVTVPLPVAALVAALVLLLGAGFVAAELKSRDSSTVRFTASPTGIRQFEITGAPEDIRKILDVLNEDDGDRTVTFEIPKDFRFTSFGEPEIRPAIQRSIP